MSATPDRLRVLVADDEPDVIAITQLALKGLQHRKKPIEVASVATGKAAVEALRSDPQIAVVLLDVVMESSSAGLDACRAIRAELGNRFVRILLRTGQPGQAPERKTIDEYDLDGYLPKPEMTSMRLYSSVRTALRAWEELVELDRYRRILSAVHECSVAMHAFDPLPATLERILQTAVSVCPTGMALLSLRTFEKQSNPRHFQMHISTDPDPMHAQEAATDIRARIAREPSLHSSRQPVPLGGGVLVPLMVHRDLGSGWLYLDSVLPDPLAQRALSLLSEHAANAVYATVAQDLLAGREASDTDSLAI